MVYANIEKCGLYQDDSREWSRKTRLDKTWSNFKDDFFLILQGDPKILKDLKYQRLYSERTRCTSQCSTFHRYTAEPHPGAVEFCYGYTSRQNINHAAHEDDTEAIDTSHSPHHETSDSTSRERLAEKLGHCSTPDEHGH